ncbi:MAG: SAM-dependent methyltransferase [Desulfuromonas sp.]|nr:MAG: SAM-dependent methyltransferase [Desulfuromonas sp.]
MTPLFDILSRKTENISDQPRRLFHGRGRTLPGYEFINIDWYPPLVLITLYALKEQDWIGRLGKELKSIIGGQLEAIVVQSRLPGSDSPRIIFGSVQPECLITEEGLVFEIEPLADQNIGIFPDMKPGRQLVRDIAANKKVLNLFAYTCAFSVAALAGGAKQVVNLDMNRNLLKRGGENHRLNGIDLRNVSFLAYDLFKSFGKLRRIGPFDLVIIDPPYHQGNSFRAERDWPKLLRRLPEIMTPSGEVIAAVSAPETGRKFLRQQFARHLPTATLLTELTGGEDFPENDPDKGLHIQHYRLKGA